MFTIFLKNRNPQSVIYQFTSKGVCRLGLTLLFEVINILYLVSSLKTVFVGAVVGLRFKPLVNFVSFFC